MRSPADMEFIQIDITNACNMRCSNCTRFCGNHEKPFFMDFETFKQAVDSLDGFEGVTGIIGGEPTLHPEFEKFAGYLQEKFGGTKKPDRLLYPQKHFIQEIHRREFESETFHENENCRYMKKHGAGLWSNMSGTYRKYYELIQDTFQVQYLNDHINPSYHQPGLFARKDLNIPDEEWIPMRDKCWIQNTWSATVTPKGAFFCEVAAALDRLFDGPGGWPIEPGWWKRKPEDFSDQLHWCEICGFALEGRTFTRDSQEETDDVSPTVYEMLKKTNSPKLRAGKINPVKIENGIIDETSKPEDKRFVIGDRYIAKYEDRFHEKNSILFKMEYIEVVAAEADFGQVFKTAICGDVDWILLKGSDDVSADELKAMFEKRIFNPGALIVGEGYLFFSKNAMSLRQTDNITSADDLKNIWDKDKVVSFSDIEAMTDPVSLTFESGKKYAIWGAGVLGEFFASLIRAAGCEVAFFVDRSKEKQGNPFLESTIELPDALNEKEYDHLVVAHHLKFDEIKKQALEIGVPEDKIIMPYEVRV